MKIKVTFDVTEYGIIGKCPECLFDELSNDEYTDLMRLVYNYFYSLDNYRHMIEVEEYGKQRKSKKKSRQKDFQKSC